ncbi:zinc finger protein 277-like [Diadema setosum]|uniref:zinc finger protein 277-like n=1 Tax=Diadema setosum TaxID=31175 RepID=UPI003B3BA5BD
MAGVDNPGSHVMEILQFPEVPENGTQCQSDVNDSVDRVTNEGACQTCMLCHVTFNLPNNADDFHQHLLQEHQLVIKGPHLICNLNKYAEYWRLQFSQESYKSICSYSENDQHYSLDPSMSQDRQIRECLQRERLDAVLTVQQRERDDSSLSRSCLFCREHFEGNRAPLFNHMAFDHNFNVGQPDNIVFANEFLDLLQSKLESLQCLYCEKTFRDKTVLKDHMRKKQHRRLNPNNKAYDRFYVINYLEAGKDWQEVQAERDFISGSLDSENEERWDDWEEELQTTVVCLFCRHSVSMATDILKHMIITHNFDLSNLRAKQGLNFYEQIKLVNFVRRCTHQSMCIFCNEKCGSRDVLLEHLASHRADMEDGPARTKWDQPQYLFPTYENDALLCALEDISDDDDELSAASPSSVSNVPIHAEDQPTTQNSILLTEHDVLRSLVNDR